MKFADRVQVQENVHWVTVGPIVRAKQAEGVRVIQISSGNPDLPTPTAVVDTLREAVQNPTYHRYPFSFQTDINEAIATYYKRRFGVTLDPQTELYPLGGSQEGIGTLGLAVIEPGTVSLVTDPAYGSYARASRFAGGDVHLLPINETNSYLPDLEAVPAALLQRARILWLNYPHNPTGAVAPLSFFEKAVAFAKKHDLIICHDGAYADVCFGDYQAPSILAVPGAKDVAVELNTLSKAFNMAGWRVGMAVGNADIIAALMKVRRNTSMGLFGPIQEAAVAALTGDQSWIKERNKIYQKRRDIVVAGLRGIGLQVNCPQASMYVWARLPPQYTDSFAFSKMVLAETGVWITSGAFFGPGGEGHIRATLTVPTADLEEAMARLQGLNGRL